jgi:hypothetical protein
VRDVLDQSLWAVNLAADLSACSGCWRLRSPASACRRDGVLVGQRTQEISLRMALGAEPNRVLGRRVRRGLTLVGAGVVLGLAPAFNMSRLIQSRSSTAPQSRRSSPRRSLTISVRLIASALQKHSRDCVNPLKALRRPDATARSRSVRDRFASASAPWAWARMAPPAAR